MRPDESVRAWIDRRTPPPPDGFRRWMEPTRPEATLSVSALASEARRSLAHVRNSDGRERAGAFDLLAADGFVTWACEAALEEADPVASLCGIVDALLE